MSFSSDWLTLRSAADGRARSALTARLADVAGTLPRPLRALDLGAGTGATVRALAPHIRPPQEWTLVDADAALLEVAAASLAGQPGLTVATRVADLTVDPPWSEPPDIVTASALFDITSAAFVERLADALAADEIPFLAMLTYDGRMHVTPEHPFDAAIIDAFNTHQRGEKSFGRALGPDAADTLTAALRRAGATVEEADSAWRLSAPLDAELMQANFDGWASAAAEIMPEREGEIAAWRRDRRDDTATVFVGHRDHFATF